MHIIYSHTCEHIKACLREQVLNWLDWETCCTINSPPSIFWSIRPFAFSLSSKSIKTSSVHISFHPLILWPLISLSVQPSNSYPFVSHPFIYLQGHVSIPSFLCCTYPFDAPSTAPIFSNPLIAKQMCCSCSSITASSTHCDLDWITQFPLVTEYHYSSISTPAECDGC